MKFTPIIALIALLFLGSCNASQQNAAEESATAATAPEIDTKAPPSVFAQSIEQAHHKVAFSQYAAIQFNLVLSFGGRERFNGTISLSTDSGKGLLETNEGGKIYFSGDKVYVSPDTENPKSMRFSAYTWPYFFMLPYKISDPGTILTDYPEDKLNGRNYLTQKLSFKSGTGDAPDDWYILYADQQTSLLQVAAYIVTGGQSSQEEAEKDPHAIEYLDYLQIEGIPIATHWKFWGWRTKEGLTDQLGEATLSNITLLKDVGKLFNPPAAFIEG